MKKQIMKGIIYTATCFVVFFALPLLVANFAPAKSGMFWSMLLLFIVNPIAVIALGVSFGQTLKDCIIHPLSVAALFLNLFPLSMGGSIQDFYIYAFVYLAIGYASMIITHFIKKAN